MSLYPLRPSRERYLVFGDGQLGTAFRELFGERVVTVSHGFPPAFPAARTHGARTPYRVRLECWPDVERALESAAPFITTVVNTAAMLFRLGCAGHPDAAYRVNATAPAEIARWCHENGKKFVQVSDAAVFPGTDSFDAPYDEYDIPKEVTGIYADSKRLGERLVRQYKFDALIVRTGRLFSTTGSTGLRRESPNGRTPWNLLLKILWAGEQGVAPELPDTVIESSTDARAVAWGVERLLDMNVSGIRHVVSEGLPISPYRFALAVQHEVAERFGRIYVKPVSVPSREQCDLVNFSLTTRYRRHLRGMPSWPQALSEHLDRFFADRNEE